MFVEDVALPSNFKFYVFSSSCFALQAKVKVTASSAAAGKQRLARYGCLVLPASSLPNSST